MELSNAIRPFNYGDIPVRTVSKDNETWWILADVCKVLELSNPTKVSDRLDDDEKMTLTLSEGHSGQRGGAQKATIISESGLYKVILRSDKPQAKEFTRWVTHEVLPSIRKHGLYAIDEVLQNPDILIAALTELKAEREKAKALQNTVAIQTQQIAEMEPKASYYDIVLKCKDLITVSVIAKDYGKSARWLNHYLHEKGIQFKQGGVWLLYQKYADCGYTKTKTHVYEDIKGENHTAVHTYFTQSGRLFIYDLLKSDGILPLIEQE